MLDFSKISVRVLVGIVVIIFGFMMFRFLSTDTEESITEYAAPVKATLKSVLKNPKQFIKKIEAMPKPKNVSWAPSPVDAIMSTNGEWDTNRFPDSFVTNVAEGFPESDEGASAARPTKWTPPSPANFALPDLTMRSELGPMATPPIGYEDPFMPEFGSV